MLKKGHKKKGDIEWIIECILLTIALFSDMFKEIDDEIL